MRLHGHEPQILKLKTEGEKTVLAKDFEPNPMVEIMNPDLVIANITDKKGKLELELFIEEGLGYSQAKERKEEKYLLGPLLLMLFSHQWKKLIL